MGFTEEKVLEVDILNRADEIDDFLDDDDWDKEPLEFDLETDLFLIMYENLRNTIGKAIDDADKGSEGTSIIPKEIMLSNIVEFNLSKLEDMRAFTLATDGKLHLCGNFLMRPFLVKLPDGSERMIPTMFILQEKLASMHKADKVVFEPEKDGIEFRKQIWGKYPWKVTSYDLPPSAAVLDTTRCQNQMMKGFGPPPGVGGMPPQGFGPPSGASGMPPQGFGPPQGMGGMPRNIPNN